MKYTRILRLHGKGKYRNTDKNKNRKYCMVTYIYSPVTEKVICDCRKVAVKLPCVVCLSSAYLFIFFR